MKSIRISLGLLALAALGFAQTATTSTTLAAAVNKGDQTITLTSATGMVPYVTNPMTGIYIDREYMTAVASVNPAGTGNAWTVKRGVAGIQSTHPLGSVVWIGPPAVFDLGPNDRVGACTASSFQFLPLIEVRSGTLMNCDANGKYSPLGMGVFYVPPQQCSFAPTTLTTTNTYPQIGSTSNLVVLNGVTNAAAGTLTLVCNVVVPSNVMALRGAMITDITTLAGSQVVAPTSVGTATLSSVTFPSAATVETASTVTPVAIGGTVTTVSPTAITSVTTAGAFLSVKSTFATAVDLSTDLRILQYTLPFVQSAASAMTINTPGLLIHYRAAF